MSDAFTDAARQTERALEQFRKNHEVQQPHHCDHECVCHRFIGSLAWRDKTRCMANQDGCKNCTHDTRPHPRAPVRPIWECPTCTSVKRAEEEAARAATLAERQRWMGVLNRGKSALKELDEDGMRSFHNQGKLDVIEWIEQESLIQRTTAAGDERQ